MRLIDADTLKEFFQDNGEGSWTYNITVKSCIDAMPTVDAVPVGVVEQFKWERDTAIQQLEEHGIPFCGKADVVAVVRCKDCVHCKPWYGDKGLCLLWSETGASVFLDGFCSYGERREE